MTDYNLKVMRALRYSQFGDPVNVVFLTDVETPQPAPGQALVRVLRSPIHNHDLATIRGVYGMKPSLPAIAGSEMVGVNESGSRVACITQGTWAEYAIATESSLVPVPDSIPDDIACQLLAMPLSALVLLEELQVRPGEWIAQNAAGGAVGRILMREAQFRGVNVVNLVRNESAAQGLRSLGARHVLVTEGEWTQRVLEVTGGAPVVRAIDSVAGAQSMEMQRLLAVRGELVVFGGLAGQAMKLDPGRMISHELVVRGFWMTALMRRPEYSQRIAQAMQRVFELAMNGDLPVSVGGVYSLAQSREALNAAETPGRTGKILFSP